MEKELKDLLINIMEQEEARKKSIENVKTDIENSKKREEMSLERLKDKLKEDQKAGVFDFTDGQIDNEIEKGKVKIREEYQIERKELETRLLELEETEKNTDSNNSKIVLSLRKYRDEMMQEQYKVQKEIKKVEDKSNVLEEQKMQELGEIDRQIREKEAQYTHLIMRNRNGIDIQNKDTAEINLLSKALEELKLQKDDIITKYQEQLDITNNEKQELINQVKEFDIKIENVNQFFGKIEVKDKTPKEIYEIVFEEQADQVPEDEDRGIQEAEEQPIEIVEEEKSEEVIEEEQPSEIVEEEKTVEMVEEEKTIEMVEEEQTAVVVEEKQSVEPVKKENIVNVVKEQKSPKAVKQEKTSVTRQQLPEENYAYFEKNRKNIIKSFMNATGIKESEADEIFKDKEHCTQIGKICRSAMRAKLDRSDIYKVMQNYYWGIESKLDIKVFEKGIRYNDELIDPIELEVFEESEYQFINKIIDQYGFIKGNNEVIYDKNIIAAIAMDNCITDSNDTLRLTASGIKKIEDYLKTITNSSNGRGSVTYNLQKMSVFRSLISFSSWSPKKINEFNKIAYKAKETYATVNAGKISKFKWAIQDWFKQATTKKITSGEEKETKKAEPKKSNSWILQPKEKEYANSRVGKYEKSRQKETKTQQER